MEQYNKPIEQMPKVLEPEISDHIISDNSAEIEKLAQTPENHTGSNPNHTDENGEPKIGSRVDPISPEQVIASINTKIKQESGIYDKIALYDYLIVNLTMQNRQLERTKAMKDQIKLYWKLLDQLKESSRLKQMEKNLAGRLHQFAQMTSKVENYPEAIKDPSERAKQRYIEAIRAEQEALNLDPGNKNYAKYRTKLEIELAELEAVARRRESTQHKVKRVTEK